jgi:hypothetical protein
MKSKTLLPRSVEPTSSPSLPDRPISDGRDRDRAARLGEQVRHLASRLRKLEGHKEGGKDLDPVLTLFQSGTRPQNGPDIEDEAPDRITFDDIGYVDETKGPMQVM